MERKGSGWVRVQASIRALLIPSPSTPFFVVAKMDISWTGQMEEDELSSHLLPPLPQRYCHVTHSMKPIDENRGRLLFIGTDTLSIQYPGIHPPQPPPPASHRDRGPARPMHHPSHDQPNPHIIIKNPRGPCVVSIHPPCLPPRPTRYRRRCRRRFPTKQLSNHPVSPSLTTIAGVCRVYNVCMQPEPTH